MTVGSLFAGIGGFDLAAERVGFEVRWQVEIDPFCRQVLEKHWPHVRRYDDVRTVGSELECVDLICGGFPCQDISVAGRGEGIDGARSGLWAQFDRLIGELRPGYVVVENVSALLARGLQRVLGDLATRGYDAEWDCLPASAFGAPHQRDRVWVVAYPASGRGEWRWSGREDTRGWRAQCLPARPSQDVADASRRGRQDLADAESGTRQRPSPRKTGHVAFSGEDVADTRREQTRAVSESGCSHARVWKQTTAKFRERSEEFGRHWSVEPDVGRVAHGVPARVDRLRGLGNAIVPQVAQWIFEQIKAAEAERITT